ncbi:MAG: DUF922 domain-containing Zn-dependent protease [Planctomycetaceae bacterium]|jgi:hypothetical protein|nr:DUF922 domain-containing Zn-dependent protease [Planctomycetaceae bacterium]
MVAVKLTKILLRLPLKKSRQLLDWFIDFFYNTKIKEVLTMQYQVFFRPFLIIGIIIISTICFISLGISEDRSVTINKNSPSGSTTFSDTKTSDKGYVRNLTVETSDKGMITEAKILVNAENDAWRLNSSGMNSYQVRFTGTQNAGAASDGSTKKQYVPKFHGQAVVKGTGGHGTPEIYSWKVQASYRISDHDMIVKKDQKTATNGTKFIVAFNGSTDSTQWKKYSYTSHNFSVSTPDPSQIIIDAVLTYIGDIPGTSVGEVAVCISEHSYEYSTNGTEKFVICDICKKTNKYRFAFRYKGNIEVTSKIIMPNWVNESTIAGEKSKAKWKRFWNNLYIHEQGHWDIAVQHAEKSKEWAQNKEGCIYVVEVCCGNDTQKAKQEATKLAIEWDRELKKKMNEELNKIQTDLKVSEQQYDVQTNHGATQGVNFLAPTNVISE